MIRGRLRPLPVLSVSLVAVVAVLLLVAALRDTTPPEIWLESPERVPAGEAFELFISANEPSTFRIHYGDLLVESVAQDVTASLLALSGRHEVSVEVEDGAGNITTQSLTVEGVDAVTAGLVMPDRLVAGDPFTATLSWTSTGAGIESLELTANGAVFRLRDGENERTLLAATPLSIDPPPIEVSARIVDEFGREWVETRAVPVAPSVPGVEELNIPATTLSVITDDGRELERQTMAQAYAEALADPLWSEPFIIPIEGRSTSGFAQARRYAPGGPVSFHEGSDIGAVTGTEILATNRGIVRVAGDYPIKGGFVAIDHGFGVFSLYLHQSRVLVQVGDEVEQGDVIGLVGSTGLSTGPHLHWEMRVDGQPTNPMAWAGKTWP